jgi:hypothetical protein
LIHRRADLEHHEQEIKGGKSLPQNSMTAFRRKLVPFAFQPFRSKLEGQHQLFVVAELLPVPFKEKVLGEVIRLSVLPAPLTTVGADRILQQKRTNDHIVDTVPSHPSILYQAVAECGNIVGDVPLRLVEHLYALIRPHDVPNDILKLANCMLSPPNIEALIVASIAQLLLKSRKSLTEQQRFDNEIDGVPPTAQLALCGIKAELLSKNLDGCVVVRSIVKHKGANLSLYAVVANQG